MLCPQRTSASKVTMFVPVMKRSRMSIIFTSILCLPQSDGKASCDHRFYGSKPGMKSSPYNFYRRLYTYSLIIQALSFSVCEINQKESGPTVSDKRKLNLTHCFL